jgi:hypothetical protein
MPVWVQYQIAARLLNALLIAKLKGRVDSEDRAAPLPKAEDMRRSKFTLYRASGALVDPAPELRALDEMERLVLTQVEAARRRRREILLRYGISLADRAAANVVVMRHTR